VYIIIGILFLFGLILIVTYCLCIGCGFCCDGHRNKEESPSPRNRKRQTSYPRHPSSPPMRPMVTPTQKRNYKQSTSIPVKPVSSQSTINMSPPTEATALRSGNHNKTKKKAARSPKFTRVRSPMLNKRVLSPKSALLSKASSYETVESDQDEDEQLDDKDEQKEIELVIRNKAPTEGEKGENTEIRPR